MEPDINTPIPELTPTSESTPASVLRHAKRGITIVMGGTILLFGISLIFLPGPAIIVIPLGLAILATELVWAKHLLKKMKEKVGIAEPDSIPELDKK